MKVYVESVLECSSDKIWDEVQKSSSFLEVIYPLVKVTPLPSQAFPQRWRAGSTVKCKSYVFGLVPLGTRSVFFERIDQAQREIQTREHDPLIRRWDHLIRVRAADSGQTRYIDEIHIDAGLLTVAVWLFAHWFYRHRQRRWKGIARRLASGEHIVVPGPRTKS